MFNGMVFFALFIGVTFVLVFFYTDTMILNNGNIFAVTELFDRSYTTIVKGVAMLCVMLCHYMGHFGNGITLFTPLGGIGVAAFLMLSSYGLNESWKKQTKIGGGVLA